ncbi:hypothetical protein BC826DRAFT_1025162 [Russula brevipes]|nr:hypothetical protein BC826DRAFT_1025162 [Russula brevipes]
MSTPTGVHTHPDPASPSLERGRSGSRDSRGGSAAQPSEGAPHLSPGGPPRASRNGEHPHAEWDALERQVLAERRRADALDVRVRELEEELARRVRAESDRRARGHDDDGDSDEESVRRRTAGSPKRASPGRDGETQGQLGEVTGLLRAHREEFVRKNDVADERWRERLEWRDETSRQFLALIGMVQGITDGFAEEKARREEQLVAAEMQPSSQDVMEELQRLGELFRALTDSLREETESRHAEVIDTVRSTANEQVPFNVQGYLNEFTKSMATEVRMLLGEVGKLREERRNIQFEIGTLLTLRSKYEAGGVFDPDWKPPAPPAPAPDGPDLPPSKPPTPPPPPSEFRQGAWRPVPQRGIFSRLRRKLGPRQAGPVPGGA